MGTRFPPRKANVELVLESARERASLISGTSTSCSLSTLRSREVSNLLYFYLIYFNANVLLELQITTLRQIRTSHRLCSSQTIPLQLLLCIAKGQGPIRLAPAEKHSAPETTSPILPRRIQLILDLVLMILKRHLAQMP